jgi:hypothetical protein
MAGLDMTYIQGNYIIICQPAKKAGLGYRKSIGAALDRYAFFTAGIGSCIYTRMSHLDCIASERECTREELDGLRISLYIRFSHLRIMKDMLII